MIDILIALFTLTLIGLLIYGFIEIYKCNQRLKRNDEVYAFRNKILYSIGLCDKYYKEKHELWAKYTYNDMLNSKKPLTLESWYTPEEIEILNNKEKENFKNLYEKR